MTNAGLAPCTSISDAGIHKISNDPCQVIRPSVTATLGRTVQTLIMRLCCPCGDIILFPEVVSLKTQTKSAQVSCYMSHVLCTCVHVRDKKSVPAVVDKWRCAAEVKYPGFNPAAAAVFQIVARIQTPVCRDLMLFKFILLKRGTSPTCSFGA